MEWKEVSANEFCIKVTDGTHDSPKPKPEGHYLLTSKHIGKGRIDYSTANIISEEDYQKVIKRSAVEQYDILFSMIGTVGNIYRETSPNIDYAVKNMGIFKMGGNELKSIWLYYWLQSPKAKGYIFERLAGSTQSYLTLDSLRNFPVIYPSEEKNMRRIANILSSLDRKIELNNKINAQLEEMAQAIFKSWFVDFEPFKDGKFVESELGMIPEGWRVGSIYEYVKVIYGAPYKSKLFNDKGEGLPLIRIRDLKDCTPQFFTKEILPNTEYIERGDIVAGMDAEFTPHIWKGEKGLLNQRVCKLKPKDNCISNLFVLYLLKPHLEYVQSYKTGTTVSHLGKGDIDGFISVLPPVEIVTKVSQIFDPILKRICNLTKETTHLSHLRDTLLPKLMSGEIEI